LHGFEGGQLVPEVHDTQLPLLQTFPDVHPVGVDPLATLPDSRH
jgi:hypothetical protein